MTEDAWGEYVAATQELDLLQRAAAEPGAAGAPDAVRTELAALTQRLAVQRERLRGGGQGDDLRPVPAEAHAAAEAVGTDPTRALTALRQAAALAEAADALLPAPGIGARSPAVRLAGGGPWQRNLLVYGPFATVASVVNLSLYAAAGSTVSALALLWMTGMALLAYGLGWLVLGLIAGGGAAAQSMDRTPLVGGAVCAVPLLITVAGLL